MTNWEFLMDWAVTRGRMALLEDPACEQAQTYVTWVFARHPDLTPVSEEM
jgi:hypothetical protein